MEIQWYPGHMARAKRQIQNDLKLVDVVVELLDARCPEESRNPDIDAFARNKGRVMLLNKADLADARANERFAAYYRARGFFVMEVDARQKASCKKLDGLIEKAARPVAERNAQRGIQTPVVRAMVLGIPNVGKSTLINTYAGRAAAKTGNKPGVTKGNQWIRRNQRVQLLDTPGITWPKLGSADIGTRLALIGSINDEILPLEDLALQLIRFLGEAYPEALPGRYGEAVQDLAPLAAYEEIARIRGCVKKGGGTDYQRTARILLDDFRSGRLGRITLGDVPA